MRSSARALLLVPLAAVAIAVNVALLQLAAPPDGSVGQLSPRTGSPVARVATSTSPTPPAASAPPSTTAATSTAAQPAAPSSGSSTAGSEGDDTRGSATADD